MSNRRAIEIAHSSARVKKLLSNGSLSCYQTSQKAAIKLAKNSIKRVKKTALRRFTICVLHRQTVGTPSHPRVAVIAGNLQPHERPKAVRRNLIDARHLILCTVFGGEKAQSRCPEARRRPQQGTDNEGRPHQGTCVDLGYFSVSKCQSKGAE